MLRSPLFNLSNKSRVSYRFQHAAWYAIAAGRLKTKETKVVDASISIVLLYETHNRRTQAVVLAR